MLVSHVLVPPAMTAILSSPTNRVQGFLAAGHVCTVMGTSEYEPLVQEFGVPIVVTGFEPLDLLEGVRQVVDLLEDGTAELRNAYPRAVSAAGNEVAQRTPRRRLRRHRPAVARDRHDPRGRAGRCRRGIAEFDAERRFGVGHLQVAESAECHAGEVLQGLLKPHECPAFGTHLHARARRWARPWCPARVRARRTTSSAGWTAMPETPVTIDPADWVCPLPLRETKRVVLGHGGGGVLSEELIENLFLPAFGSGAGPARDSAVLEIPAGRIACHHRFVCGATACSFPAATSATSPSTAPSTIWRAAAPSRSG